MAERTERALLNHLIEICRDAARGFRTAAEQVTTPELKALFVRLADQRHAFAEALLPHAQRLGGDRARQAAAGRAPSRRTARTAV